MNVMNVTHHYLLHYLPPASLYQNCKCMLPEVGEATPNAYLTLSQLPMATIWVNLLHKNGVDTPA